MKQFKYPLAIEGTREQLEKLIPKLEELGYIRGDKGDMEYADGYRLCTFFSNTSCNTLGFYYGNKHTLVSATNTELVLALAACTEGDEISDGEYCYWSGHKARVVKIIDRCRAFPNDSYTDGEPSISGRPHSFNYKHLRKLSKEEIIAHFNKQPMEKKIIGYNLKKGVSRIMLDALGGESNGIRNVDRGYEISIGSPVHEQAEKLGIISAIFEPVYEPEKPKVEIVTLRCEGGSFEVEVSKEGIFYKKDKSWLCVEQIMSVCLWGSGVEIDFKRKEGISGSYPFKISHIDSGCKKQVPVEDWKKVVSVYENFKKE